MTDWPAMFEAVANEWQPQPQTAVDVVDASAPADFAAMLDQPSPVTDEGDPLPPLWHWFLHHRIHLRAALGTDGHPRTGDELLPPLPDDRRRMFGGGRVEVVAPLRCGDRVERTSEIANCRATEGRSGPLLVTTVRHTLTVEGSTRVVEEQQVVYLPARDTPPDPPPSTQVDTSVPAAPNSGTTWSLELVPDPVLLFRFSALTANAHRIHYDRPFAREVEGYPDLVVQGPLSALLLAELPRRHAPDHRMTHLHWRARRPAYRGQSLRADAAVDGGQVDMALHAGSTDRAVIGTATLQALPERSGA